MVFNASKYFEFIFLFATIGFLMMYVLSNSNKTLATIESSANSSMSDVFGIRKIYETKPGGFEWYMNMGDPQEDPHLYNYDDMQENNDNSYNIGDRSRMSVYSEDGVGYEEGSMKTYDFSELSSRGYWYKPSDWKNVEVTGEYFNKEGDGPGITHYVRSEDHSKLHDGCGGSSYKNKIYFYGTSNFNKEQAHPTSWESSHILHNHDLKSNWFRFKTIIYNHPNGTVFLENWLDPNNNNNWIKIGQFVDNGGWGEDGTKCGGTPDHIITWGSPMITFRWDDISIDFRNLSVREIEPAI